MMSEQQDKQSLLHKKFDRIYMITFFVARYIYFSLLNPSLLLYFFYAIHLHRAGSVNKLVM